MKIFSSLETGFYRSLKSLKGVLIAWLTMFFLAIVFIYPLRGSLSSAFGSSMITEKLADGFDIEVFADLGPALGTLLSFITSGFMLIYFIGFVINAFITSGLFGSVRKGNEKFSAQEFFRAGSKNFWPFFIISLNNYYHRNPDGGANSHNRNVRLNAGKHPDNSFDCCRRS
jgi:hypothetical protein